MSPSGRGQPMYSENTNRYSSIANMAKKASVNQAILLRRLTTRSHSAICSRVHTSSRSLLLILWGLRLGALQAKQRTRDCSDLEPHLLQIHMMFTQCSHLNKNTRRIMSRPASPSLYCKDGINWFFFKSTCVSVISFFSNNQVTKSE